MWIYQRMDLLYFGYCLYLYIVCRSTREWICCILDTVHILDLTVYLCKLSEYLYADILWLSALKGSQDTDNLFKWNQKGSQDILLTDTKKITGQIAGQSGQTRLAPSLCSHQ